jgi:hypothetical protein
MVVYGLEYKISIAVALRGICLSSPTRTNDVRQKAPFSPG